MSIYTDILHLRNSGFWPDNTTPQWALDESAKLSLAPDATEVIVTGLMAEVERLGLNLLSESLARDVRQQALDEASAEISDRLRFRNPAKQAPEVGPLYIVLGAGWFGVARRKDAGAWNVLWSEGTTGAVRSYLPFPQTE